jgi:hypothetical protein
MTTAAHPQLARLSFDFFRLFDLSSASRALATVLTVSVSSDPAADPDGPSSACCVKGVACLLVSNFYF